MERLCELVTVTLGIFAAIIFLIYSFYFVRIIKGNPRDFEIDMLEALAEWMVKRGTSTQPQIWILIVLSAVVEVFYFLLVFSVLNNPVIVILTAFFAGLEAMHLLLAANSFNKFFKDKILLKDIFNWRLERISAMFFFTHSFLVLLSLFLN